MPLSSLTLFFSELNSDPCVAFCTFASNFKSGIPITPWVLALIGGRPLLPLLPPDDAFVPVLGTALGDGAGPDPSIGALRLPIGEVAVAPPLTGALGGAPPSLPALVLLLSGAMIA